MKVKELQLSKKGLLSQEDPLAREMKELRIQELKEKMATEQAGKEVPDLGTARTKQDADKMKEIQGRAREIKNSLNKLKATIEKTGTYEMFGPESGDMDSAIYQAAVDYAKLVDPNSVAREGEVAAAQKYMLPVKGLGVANSTAQKILDERLLDVDKRVAESAKSYGLLSPGLMSETPKVQNVVSHPQAQEALSWAKTNPNNPKAIEIMNRLGATNGIAR
jgi:hypothetical protein